MSNIHLENVDSIKFDKICYPGLKKYAREMTISFKNGDVLRIIFSSSTRDGVEVMDCEQFPGGEPYVFGRED